MALLSNKLQTQGCQYPLPKATHATGLNHDATKKSTRQSACLEFFCIYFLQGRLALDKRLSDLLLEIGSTWLGAWQCLLMQPLNGPAPAVLQQATDHFEAACDAASRPMITRTVALLAAGAEALSQEQVSAAVVQICQVMEIRMDASHLAGATAAIQQAVAGDSQAATATKHVKRAKEVPSKASGRASNGRFADMVDGTSPAPEDDNQVPKTAMKPQTAAAHSRAADADVAFSLPPPRTVLKPSNRGAEEEAFSLKPPRTVIKSVIKPSSRFGAMAPTPATHLGKQGARSDSEDDGCPAPPRRPLFADENDPAPRTAAPKTAKKVSRLAAMQNGAEPQTCAKQMPAFRRFALLEDPEDDDTADDQQASSSVPATPLYPASIARHAIARARPSAARAAAAAKTTAAAAEEVAQGIAEMSLASDRRSAAGRRSTRQRASTPQAQGAAAAAKCSAPVASTASEASSTEAAPVASKPGPKSRASARRAAAVAAVSSVDEDEDAENRPPNSRPASAAVGKKPRGLAARPAAGDGNNKAVSFASAQCDSDIELQAQSRTASGIKKASRNNRTVSIASDSVSCSDSEPEVPPSAAAARPRASTSSRAAGPGSAAASQSRPGIASSRSSQPAAAPHAANAAGPSSSSSSRPCGLILTLDSTLQELPWESLPALGTSALYRCPNVMFAQALVLRSSSSSSNSSCQSAAGAGPNKSSSSRNRMASKASSASGSSSTLVRRQGAIAPARAALLEIDLASAYYLLNPEGDLPETQQTFESLFQHKLHWSGTAGARPTSEELRQALEGHELYAYFGHGGGSQYLQVRACDGGCMCAGKLHHSPYFAAGHKLMSICSITSIEIVSLEGSKRVQLAFKLLDAGALGPVMENSLLSVCCRSGICGALTVAPPAC